MTVEIILITHECLSKTMAVVQHGRHTIEAETIEVELLKPILTVGKQEVQHIVLAIVEAERIPCWMLMTVAWIEELIRITGKVAQTFDLVLHGM